MSQGGDRPGASSKGAACAALTWAELSTSIDLAVRMTVEDGLLGGLSSIHRAIFATGTGTVAEMLAHLDASLIELTAARDALAGALAVAQPPRSCQ